MKMQSTGRIRIMVDGQAFTYWMDMESWCMYAQNKAGDIRMISRSSYLRDEQSVRHAILEAFGKKSAGK